MNVLTAIALLSFMSVLALTAPTWSRLLRQRGPAVSMEDEGEPAAQAQSREEEPARGAERTINVQLFFPAADRPGLVLEERAVPFASELSVQLRTVVEELARGSRGGFLPSLGPGTRVLDVFVSGAGVAYVNLSKEAAQDQPGGSEAELLSVYSVVNSLTTSFPAVKRVQILIDDHSASTFNGHLDLSRPLPPDPTLLASSSAAPGAAPPPPAASPSPSPGIS
jgi:spore germination protein GerM